MRRRMEFGLNPSELQKRKCDPEWTLEKKIRARHWVVDGAVTQDAMCKYGWANKNECKLCGGPGTEKHRLH